MSTTAQKYHIPDLILDDYEAPPIFVLNCTKELQYFNKKFSLFCDRKWNQSPELGIELLQLVRDVKQQAEINTHISSVLAGEKIKAGLQIDDQNYHFHYRPLLEENQIIGVTISIENYRDTSHEVLKEELSKNEFEQESVGTWEMDMHTGEILFSGFWKQFMRDGKVDLSDEKSYFLSIIAPEDLKKLQKYYETARHKKIDHFHQKYKIYPADDTHHWISSSSSIEYNVNGKPSRIISICRDITQEKELEQKWQEEEILLREIERISNLGHYEYDFVKDYWTSSIQLNKIFGIDQDYPKNIDSWVAIIHPDDQEKMVSYLQEEVFGEKKAFDKVYKTINKDTGITQYVHGKGRLIFNDDGNPIRMIGTIQDVTEIKEREQELMRMSKFAEHTQSGLLVTDPKGLTTWVHPSMKVLSGHTLDDMVGKTPGEVLQGPNTDPAHVESFNKGLASLKPFKQEILNYNKDGSLMWNEVQVTPVFDDENQLVEFLGVQVDITERKQLEEELALSEYKLRTITNSLPAMILRFTFETDGTFELLYISDGIENIYKTKAEEAYQNSSRILEKIHEEDLEQIKVDLLEAAEKLTEWSVEWRVLQADKSWKWVRGQASPTKQEDGSVLWDGLVTDITEVKEAQQAEEIANERFKTLVNSVYGIIWESDENFNINYASDQSIPISGFTPEEWCHKAFWRSRLHPDERDEILRVSEEKIHAGENHQLEYRFKHKLGHYIWVRDWVTCNTQKDGTTFLNGIIIDVTEIKAAQEEKRNATDRLERIVDSVHGIIWESEEGDRLTYASSKSQEILGFKPDDILERAFFWSRIHPDDL
ncbi:MAG: PAS domain-containing protein, partial [Ekhidna sp.]|nr:PAS domain-containing protein [Ekhidna sp.]